MVNRTTPWGALVAALVWTSIPGSAYAESAPAPVPAPAAKSEPKAPAEPERPILHHAPLLTAAQSSEQILEVTLERAHLVKRVLLVYRGGGASGEVELARGSSSAGTYVGIVPALAVRDRLLYSIELETTAGEHVAAFATREHPHEVTVLDDLDDRTEKETLARLRGRRSVVEASGEYASFGSVTRANGVSSPDHFYRFEGAFTYRLLGLVSELGLRAGAVRGESLVSSEADSSRNRVGLNYGAPRVRLRATDWLHFEGELLTSVTEVGFSVGGGGAVLIGDPYGTKLVLGGEGIEVFGARGYTRLDVLAHPRLLVAPIVEVTGMPHAETAGVRLLGEARFDLGVGFGLIARGGYQARTFNRGGPSFGAGVSYAF